MRRRVVAAAGLAALIALVAPTARADVVPGATPAVNRIGDARIRPATDTVVVPVTYKCTDRPGPSGITHYLTVQFAQPGAESYQAGVRNNANGLLQATCTGKRRTDYVVLFRNANAITPKPSPVPSTATVTVELTQHTTQDAGGWYVRTQNDALLTRTVLVH